MSVNCKRIFPEISTLCLICNLIIVQSVCMGDKHAKALPFLQYGVKPKRKRKKGVR